MANVSQDLAAQVQPEAVDKKEAKRQKKEARIAAKAEAKAAKVKRKGITPLRAALMTFLLMIFLLLAATTLIYFDVVDRHILVNALLEGDNPYRPQIERIEQLSRSLAEESLALEQAKADFEEEKKLLEKEQKTLASRETAIVTQQANLDASTTLAAESEENIAKLVAMYEKMDASSAAMIMEEMYDVEDVARLLSRMKQDKASGILSAMSSARAARVTELLLY